MIADKKTIKTIRDVYTYKSPNPYMYTEGVSLKKCFYLAVSLCSVMVIVASFIASL
jgi:hypothetical protein